MALVAALSGCAAESTSVSDEVASQTDAPTNASGQATSISNFDVSSICPPRSDGVHGSAQEDIPSSASIAKGADDAVALGEMAEVVVTGEVVDITEGPGTEHLGALHIHIRPDPSGIHKGSADDEVVYAQRVCDRATGRRITVESWLDVAVGDRVRAYLESYEGTFYPLEGGAAVYAVDNDGVVQRSSRFEGVSGAIHEQLRAEGRQVPGVR